MRQIPSIAVEFVAAHEGFRAKAYLDVAGVPTIGFGTIKGVKMGDTITREKALQRLADDMVEAQERLYNVVKPEVIACLTVYQWAALLSFVYNVGAGKNWTIWKRLNAEQYDVIPLELMKFVNAGGKKVQGLVNRRADEIKLWSTEEPGSTDEKIPSSVTRFAETPPTPASPTPPQRSATVLTTATTAVGSTTVAATAVYDAVKPFKEESPAIQNAVALIATALAILAAVAALLVFLAKRKQRQ